MKISEVSRSLQNPKREKKIMQNLLENMQKEPQSEQISAGMDLLAANYYHPNGHTMPFLIGLEYATYRWMRLANDDVFDDDPTQCAICRTDFTTSWVKIDEKTLCEKCAKINIKNKAHNIQKRKMQESLMKTFLEAHQKVSAEYEAKQAKRRRIDELHRKIQEKENNPPLALTKSDNDSEADGCLALPSSEKVQTEENSESSKNHEKREKIIESKESDQADHKMTELASDDENKNLSSKDAEKPVQEPEISEICSENGLESMETECNENIEKSGDKNELACEKSENFKSDEDQGKSDNEKSKTNETKIVDRTSSKSTNLLDELENSPEPEKEDSEMPRSNNVSQRNNDPSSIIDSIIGDDFNL